MRRRTPTPWPARPTWPALPRPCWGGPWPSPRAGPAQPVGREMLAMASKADMSFEPGEHTIGASLTVTFALGDE